MPTTRKRFETFAVVERQLARDVVPARGRPYCHTCTVDTFADVAAEIEAHKGRSFTGEEVRDALEGMQRGIAKRRQGKLQEGGRTRRRGDYRAAAHASRCSRIAASQPRGFSMWG